MSRDHVACSRRQVDFLAELCKLFGGIVDREPPPLSRCTADKPTYSHVASHQPAVSLRYNAEQHHGAEVEVTSTDQVSARTFKAAGIQQRWQCKRTGADQVSTSLSHRRFISPSTMRTQNLAAPRGPKSVAFREFIAAAL
eukprot:scaffold4628_cov146-Skeletonema_dohrnii-CCMP3373.AAC.21